MANARQEQSTQSWLIDAMAYTADPTVEPGYRVDEGGMCNGLAYMAAQAILAGDIKKFEDRIKLIRTLSPATLKKLMNDRAGSQYKISLLHNDSANIKSEIQITDSDGNTEIIPIKSPFNLTTTVELKELIHSVQAFFDGIQLYANIHKLPYLFEKNNKPYTQDYKFAKTLALPVNFKENDMIEMSNIGGQYYPASLKDYLEGFIALSNITGGNISFPIVLNNEGHTITIGFDHQGKNGKHFILVDANLDDDDPDVKYFSEADINEFVKDLQTAFYLEDNPNAPIIFTSNLLLKSDAPTALITHIDTWKQELEHYILNLITTNKVNIADPSGVPWLYLTAASGQLKITEHLLNHGALVNKGFQDITPLCIAAHNGHDDIVKMLLAHGADLHITSNNIPPLYVAAQNGRYEIVKLLVDYGADVNRTANLNETYNNVPPILAAIIKGHEKIAHYLFEKGANIEIAIKAAKKFKLGEDAIPKLVHIKYDVLSNNVIEEINRIQRMFTNSQRTGLFAPQALMYRINQVCEQARIIQADQHSTAAHKLQTLLSQLITCYNDICHDVNQSSTGNTSAVPTQLLRTIRSLCEKNGITLQMSTTEIGNLRLITVDKMPLQLMQDDALLQKYGKEMTKNTPGNKAS